MNLGLSAEVKLLLRFAMKNLMGPRGLLSHKSYLRLYGLCYIS